jgi:hypothetical protein
MRKFNQTANTVSAFYIERVTQSVASLPQNGSYVHDLAHFCLIGRKSLQVYGSLAWCVGLRCEFRFFSGRIAHLITVL